MDFSPYHDFLIREGTLDDYIYDSIIQRNEYRLPEAFHENDIVIDIGSHIGAFSHAAIKRSARRVIAVEADPENFHMAAFNLRHAIREGYLTLLNAAVWRSDIADNQPIYVEDYHVDKKGYLNTGGIAVGEQVTSKQTHTIGFDNLLARYVEPVANGKLYVKFDCEGSEWPILMTSRKLDLIDAICGEYHIDRLGRQASLSGTAALDELFLHLDHCGFKYHRQVDTENPRLGLFWAVRAG